MFITILFLTCICLVTRSIVDVDGFLIPPASHQSQNLLVNFIKSTRYNEASAGFVKTTTTQKFLSPLNVKRVQTRHTSNTTNNKKYDEKKARLRNKAVANNQSAEKTVVIMYHKKQGVITSHSSSDIAPASNQNEAVTRTTVYDDIMSMEGFIPSASDIKDQSFLSFQEATGIKSKLHAIGRLDADTTGLLLLTNDGGLVHHVTNPKASSSSNVTGNKQNKVIKTYDALIMGYHTLDKETDNEGVCEDNSTAHSSSQQLQSLLDGVDIGAKYGGMTLPPDDLQVLGHPTAKSTLVRISISEGKNRQVRRMFHAINSGVMRLHRKSVGALDLNILNGEDHAGDRDNTEGCWRVLSDEEVRIGLGWNVRDINTEKYVDKGKQKKSSGSKRRSASSPKRKRRRS